MPTDIEAYVANVKLSSDLNKARQALRDIIEIVRAADVDRHFRSKLNQVRRIAEEALREARVRV